MNTPKPRALQSCPPGSLVHLDVREDIRAGREPFARIMATVQRLGQDQVFVLRAPFEPLPLYALLGKHGFVHWSESRAGDDWSIWFWRPRPDATGDGGPPPPRAPGQSVRVDVRGLEPPLPMTRVLQILATLAPGHRLIVIHERRPMLLYPQLEDLGFRHATEEVGPGEFRITVWREGPGA